MHDHALAPMRAAMRSISAASWSLSWTLASRSRCCCTTISVAAGGQPDKIEAKTGIERIVQRIEPFANRSIDHFGFRHRTPGIDRYRAHRAVGAEETGFQFPRAFACLSIAGPASRPAGQVRRSTPRGDRFGEAFFPRYNPARFARADRRIVPVPAPCSSMVVKARRSGR